MSNKKYRIIETFEGKEKLIDFKFSSIEEAMDFVDEYRQEKFYEIYSSFEEQTDEKLEESYQILNKYQFEIYQKNDCVEISFNVDDNNYNVE